MIYDTDGKRFWCVDCGRFVSRADAMNYSTGMHLCAPHVRLWLEGHDGAGDIVCPPDVIAYWAQFEPDARARAVLERWGRA